jgi:hypothetical protein
MRVRLKLKQFTDRARLAVAARKHEPRAVLIPCVETLNPERTQFHDVQYRARFPATRLTLSAARAKVRLVISVASRWTAGCGPGKGGAELP